MSMDIFYPQAASDFTTHLIVCIDGCSPDYFRQADTPTLDALAIGGFYKEVRAMVPTVTNVNNVSIVTGAYPVQHGITSNYYRNRETGQAVPIIKDRYVAHHQNMGGAAYIYLENRHHLLETVSVLETWPGVEKVLTAEESTTLFHLHPARIGDLLVRRKLTLSSAHSKQLRKGWTCVRTAHCTNNWCL